MLSLRVLLSNFLSRKRNVVIGTAVVVFLFSIVVYTDSFRIFKKEEPIKLSDYRTEPLSLAILGMKVNGSSIKPTSLTFSFSDEVSLHVFEHQLEISPEISGFVKQGKNKRELIYEFTEELPKEVYYIVRVNYGLKSVNGKTLLVDYQNSFRTENEDTRLQFMDKNFHGRVFTFTNHSPVQIKVGKNPYSGKNNPQFEGKAHVKLYRSSQANLLNFLVYENFIDPKYPESTYVQQRYIRNFIEHKEAEFIKEYVFDAIKEDFVLSEQLGPGIYYLEASDDAGPITATFAVVSSLGMVLRQDDQQVTLKSYNIATGQAVSTSADVGLYTLKDAPVLLKSQKFGNEIANIPLPFVSTLDVVIGRIGEEPVFIPVKVPQSTAEILVSSDLEKTHKLFLYTERPVYKPGDVVNFRGMVRVDSDGLYKLPPANTAIYIRLDSSDNPAFSTTVYTNAQGLFWGNFKAPSDDPNNLYDSRHSLYASTTPPGKNNYYYASSAYFDVFSYIKPEFGIETSVGKPEYVGSEKISFKIVGKTFTDKPLKGEKIEYKLYTDDYYEAEKAVYNSNFNITSTGGMCGGGFSSWEEYYGAELPGGSSVTLNDQGEATVEYSVSKDSLLSQTITLVASKTDANNNKIVSAIKTLVHAAEVNIFFTPSSTYYKPGETVVAPFYAETLNGEKLVNKDLKYSFAAISYGSGNPKEEIIREGVIKTDANGAGIVTFIVPSDISASSRYINLEVVDTKGNKSRAQKYIYLMTQSSDSAEYYPEEQSGTQLKIISPKNSFIVGDTMFLDVESPAELDVLMTLERGRVYSPQSVHLVKGKNTINIPVDTRLSPSITVVFTFFMEGKYYTEGLSLNVPAMHKVLTMNIVPNKTRYVPGETAEIRITTNDYSGNPVPADVSLGIVDKAIYALRKNATPPVHSTLYAYRRRQTNASSSLSRVGIYDWGGRGGGGGGGEGGDGKQVDTLYWNPEIKTNRDGWATVQVPLGNSQTTWKALGIGSTSETQVGQADAEFVVAQ